MRRREEFVRGFCVQAMDKEQVISIFGGCTTDSQASCTTNKKNGSMLFLHCLFVSVKASRVILSLLVRSEFAVHRVHKM